MSAEFDLSELLALSEDIAEAPVKAIPNVRKAVEFTARGVKNDWRKYSAEHNIDGTLSGYPASIDYDMELDTDGTIGAEIGPNLGKNQGSFGFVEDSPGGVRSYARHDDRDALKANEKDFSEGLGKAIGDVL